MMPENCSVCNTALQGEFCHKCGQKHTGQQVTFPVLLSDFTANIVSLERSFVATLWLLLKNPAQVVQNYWLGNRLYYSSPAKMLFYALTVAALHIALVDNKILGLTFAADNLAPQVAFYSVLIPIMAFASSVAFYKQRRNFAMHIISVVYNVSSLIIVFLLLNDLIGLAFTANIGARAFLVYLIFFCIWNTRCQIKTTKIWTILGYSLLQIAVVAGIFGVGVAFTLLLRWVQNQ
ncbi:DUF3667 domain-containing protein [bacterium]|nr:DUF3667 domain-containing protein [bacterium]